MVARTLVCLAALCGLLFLACWLGTGDDRRNMRSIASYPGSVRRAALADPQLAVLAPAPRPAAATFLANLALFSAVLVVVGLVVSPAPRDLGPTFLALLAVGEGLGLFDLLVIDLAWWRHSPRVRLAGVGDPAAYLDPRPHVASFLRGIPMFALAALVGAPIACALPV